VLSPDRAHRSHLFAPASNEELVDKALSSEADAVVLDLEDAVTDLVSAHQILASASHRFAERPTHVRVGLDRDGYRTDDLDRLAGTALEAVRLPKVFDPGWVRSVSEHLDAAGSRAVIHLTVESAGGLARLTELVTASNRVSRVVFGERDFLADLGVDEPGLLTDHARADVAIVSRAHGLGTPIDGAYIDLEDDEGLRRSCERARGFGFGGKSALHPRQLEVIHQVFSPSGADRDRAQGIVDAYEVAKSRGEATTVVSGRFVDEAVARRAKAVVESAEEAR
jgi:citrate lyase subunit beta / citryl-CoA lyase